MKLIEKHYESSRGNCHDSYQTLSVTLEAEEKGRAFIRFTLMEQRWRSIKEASSYLRWAADELEGLEKEITNGKKK